MRKCTGCRKNKEELEFNLRNDGRKTNACSKCLSKKAMNRHKKKKHFEADMADKMLKMRFPK